MFRGLRREFWNLRQELYVLGRHLQALAHARALEPPLRLNLGSFTDLRAGWVNIDPFVRTGTLPLDLREPLPFPDGSVELAHAEHFLEHLSEGDAQRLLRECKRVLKAGGLLSVTVPDAEPLLRAYATGDREAFRHYEATIPARRSIPTPLGQINYLLRQEGTHRYAYDEQTLRLLLEDAGFIEINRREFDPELDLEVRREGTLRMSARSA